MVRLDQLEIGLGDSRRRRPLAHATGRVARVAGDTVTRLNPFRTSEGWRVVQPIRADTHCPSCAMYWCAPPCQRCMYCMDDYGQKCWSDCCAFSDC
jgi:hypothetical protein